MIKKLTSFLLVIAMIMGLTTNFVFAYDAGNAGAVSPDRANISYVYLGKLTSSQYTYNAAQDRYSISNTASTYSTIRGWTAKDIDSDLEVGDMIWVGVQVSNLSKVRDVFRSNEQGPDSGLQNASFSLWYDTDILKPASNLLAAANTQTAIKNYGESTVYGGNMYTISSQGIVDFGNTTTAGLDAGDSECKLTELGSYTKDNINASDSKIKGVNVTVAVDSNKDPYDDQRMMQDNYTAGTLLGDDPVIMAVFPLVIQSVPANGKKVLQGALSGDRLTMATGFDSTSETHSLYWVYDQSGATTGDQPTDNLKNYFNVTNADGTKPSDGVINIFPVSYKVTYDANSANFTDAGYLDSVTVGIDNVETVGEGEDATLTVGSPAVNPSTLLKPIDGKVFEGWYTKDGTSDDWGTKIDNSDAAHTLTVTADTTLYAKYTDGHKITYNLNAADAKFKDSTTAAKGFPQPKNTAFRTDSATTLNDMVGGVPERTGYTFMGWYKKEADGTFSTKYTDTILDDDTNSYDLYAMWSRDSSSYTLTFNNNGGETAADPATVGFNAGDDLATVLGGMPVEPTKTDYVFTGWYKNQSGDGDKLTANDVLNDYHGSAESFTVYARWDNIKDGGSGEPEPKDTDTIQVKFNKNGGEYKPSGATTDTAITDKYVKSGDTLKMPLDADMSKTDKAFGGWWTSDDGGTTLKTKVDDTTPITGSLDGYTAASPGPGGQITLYAKWLDKVKIEYDLNGLTTGTKPADQTDLIPGATDLTIAAAPTDIAADYSITEWNTKANGTGVSYTPGATGQTVPAANTKLYAIWDYNGADAITVTFDGNGTDAKPATLTPNDGGSNTGKYTVKRAPNYVITADQQPTATRTDYEFDHWDASPSAAAGSLTAITVADESGTSAQTMTRYGIWTVDPLATAVTVTFNLVKHADATDSDTFTPASITPVTIAQGDSLGTRMPADPELSGGYGFSNWEIVSGTVTGKSAGATFTKDDIVTADTTVKSIWTKEVKITFEANGGTVVTTGTNTSLDAIKVDPGSNVATSGKRENGDPMTAMPAVEKTGYEFLGWYDKDNPTTKIEDTTNLTSSVTVKAKWGAKIKLNFTDDTDTYDGTAKTPLTTSNISVDLLDPSDPDVVITPNLTGFADTDFSIKFRENGTSDPFSATAPTDAKVYDIEVGMAKTDKTKGTDAFTVYDVSYDNTFTIEQAEVNLRIKNNYQYHANASSIVAMTVEVDGTTPTGYVLANEVDITFDKDEPTETTTVPMAFGEYTVTIEAKDGSNYAVGTVTDDYAGVTPAGDKQLHIMRTAREVNVDYGAGTAVTGTLVSGTVYTYTNVALTTPSPVTNLADFKTTLASQSPAKDVPQENTDFTAPTGKRIKYFVTNPSDEENTVFTKTTDITSSADPLVIYAIYENAEWTATFNDTKTGTAKEDTVKYTIGAEKAIADASGTQKIETSPDDTTWTEDTSATKTVLPELENAPDNKKFFGWTKNKPLADGSVLTTGTYAALKESDFTGSGTYVGELFTDANKPGDSYITAGTTDVQLYAVYVLSGDATLKAVTLKEDNSTGADATFVNSDYTTPGTAITFDPDTDTYTAIISNGKDLFAELTPSQPGATIAVTKATADATTTSPTGTAVTGISTADSEGKVNFTSDTDATTYTSADGNTVNQYKVTVTAPDGTTKTYTFNVLEYAEYKIELNPGNSPYGLIERMGKKDTGAWDKDKIQDAKDAFWNSDASHINLKYGTGFVPDNGETAVTYTSVAWGSGKNYDLDSEALFVYEAAKFKDPGFTIYDELAKPVSSPSVTKSLSLKRISAGVPTYATAEGTDTPINEVSGEYDLAGNIYRPDVYKIAYEYQYTDPIDSSNKTLTIDRPLILLSRRGDIQLTATPLLNANDATALKNNWSVIAGRSALFAWRSADVQITATPLLNANDATTLKNKWAAGFDQFYKILD